MTEEQRTAKASSDEAILQEQYLRSLSSFEGILLSQMEMKSKLSDRLNYSIRAGLILLGVIAFSILVLLLTLSSQINRMTEVVVGMNSHFDDITMRMNKVTNAMDSMDKQVSLLAAIDYSTDIMEQEMGSISEHMSGMTGNVDGVRQQLAQIRGEMTTISTTVGQMNSEIGVMTLEMQHLAKPARSINRIFPLP